jgi:hypothetical protein
MGREQLPPKLSSPRGARERAANGSTLSRLKGADFNHMAQMQNMNVKIEGRKLTIEIDLDVVVSTTSNGNKLIASTGSWVPVEEMKGLTINMAVVGQAKKGW